MPENVENFYRFASQVDDVPYWPIAAILLILALIVGLVKLREYRLDRDGTWHCDGVEMRRWVNGRWERRPMTKAEAFDWNSRAAW